MLAFSAQFLKCMRSYSGEEKSKNGSFLVVMALMSRKV